MSFDAHSHDYREKVNRALAGTGTDSQLVLEAKATLALELLERRLGPTSKLKLLDVGCGIGAMHPLLEPHLGELHGVDPAAEAIARAAEDNPGVRYRAFDGVTLPFDDGSFDAALAVCVMHHVPPARWSGFLREIARVLRPGGVLLVFEHNPLNPATRWIVNRCEFDRDAVLLSWRTVRRLAPEAGLKPEEDRTLLYLPVRSQLVRRLERPLGRFPFGAQYYVALTKR